MMRASNGDGAYIYRRLIRCVNEDTCTCTPAKRRTAQHFAVLYGCSCGISLMPLRPAIVAVARKILMNKNSTDDKQRTQNA